MPESKEKSGPKTFLHIVGLKRNSHHHHHHQQTSKQTCVCTDASNAGNTYSSFRVNTTQAACFPLQLEGTQKSFLLREWGGILLSAPSVETARSVSCFSKKMAAQFHTRQQEAETARRRFPPEDDSRCVLMSSSSKVPLLSRRVFLFFLLQRN